MVTSILAPGGVQAASLHPMDSSRILMAMLRLVKQGGNDADATNRLAGIIPVEVFRHLLSALHFRDVNTLKHSRRVGILSVGIATRLGWEESELRSIEVASLLHDIGKLGIPDHIMHKPGKLSPDEAEYIAIFHRVGVELLQACQVSPSVTKIIAESHFNSSENSKELTLGARILAVADAYDSLTSHQTYREAFSRSEAMKILEEQSGKRFDRNVVAALKRWLDSGDSGILDDEAAADEIVKSSAPIDEETQIGAGLISQLFTYLYTLESLYDAFYFLDENQTIVIWSAGAAELFGRTPKEMLGLRWERSMVSSLAKPLVTDAVDKAFHTSQPQCHRMRVRAAAKDEIEVDVQALPILDEHNEVAGVAELLCDCSKSKRNTGHFRELQLAATKDALTGVMNRGELDGQIGLAHEAWEGTKTPYSVVFLDLDHFKAINDRLGHSVGDRVLIDVARLVEDELYSGERIGRYGGEEFVVLCPETALPDAVERAERLRRTINSAIIAGREDLRVTASFGAAQVEAGDQMTDVVKRADEALYDAKHSGRNRTCFRQRDSKQTSRKQKRGRKWEYHSQIVAQVTADLLPMKLTGFIEDNTARILKVKPDAITVEVGRAGLWGGWGRAPKNQPIRLFIEIHDAPGDGIVSRNKRILLKITSTPVVKPGKIEAFEDRARHVTENLRSYLIGD